MCKFRQVYLALLVTTGYLITIQPQHICLAQVDDILRVGSVPVNKSPPTPPQQPTLTPEQVQALLQELQQARQAQSLASQPTSQPAGQVGAQIPEPTSARSEPQSNGGPVTSTGDAEKEEDGSYNEAGTEMEGAGGNEEPSSGSQPIAAQPSSPQQPTQPQGAAAAAPNPIFEVNWNKCPQLEPNEGEKNKKTQVITKCLQQAPIPANLTRENVEAHREQIATCALKAEDWFDEAGNYRYDKAESEIRVKKLDAPIEVQVLKFHVACKDEANNKFPRNQKRIIDQVQFYQACMDYYISIVCEIEVSVDQ